MRIRSHDLLDEMLKHWLIGVVVSVLVFIIIFIGLSTRSRFIAHATVEVGGIYSEMSPWRFEWVAFEDADTIQDFYVDEVFSKASNGISQRCDAVALNVSGGVRLRLKCKGQDKSELLDLILSGVEPLLLRHAIDYQLAKSLEDQHRQQLEREMQDLKIKIEILQKLPPSGFFQVMVIDYQQSLEAVQNQLELNRSMGDRVRPTRSDPKDISINDRKPALADWIVVLALALFSGAFMAGSVGLIQRAEND